MVKIITAVIILIAILALFLKKLADFILKKGKVEAIKRVCIICRKEKPIEEFNEEHVFPATIGGEIKINCVCVVCNGKLGKGFDTPFLRDPRIGIWRKTLSLRRTGPERDIPNPLSKAKVGGADGGKFYVTYDDAPKIVMKRTEDKIVRGLTGWNVTIVGKPDSLEKKKDEILKAYGYTDLEIENVTRSVTEITRPVTFETTDEVIMKEGLKIAYEFTAATLPDYLKDDWSIDYATCLEKGELTAAVKERIDASEKYMEVCKNEYEYLEKYPPWLHSIFVKSYKGFGTICVVKIFNYFLFYRMSINCVLDLDYEMIALNDPISRKRECEIRHLVN